MTDWVLDYDVERPCEFELSHIIGVRTLVSRNSGDRIERTTFLFRSRLFYFKLKESNHAALCLIETISIMNDDFNSLAVLVPKNI